MPLATTKQAAKTLQRRLRRAAEEVRLEWTSHERRQRRLAAFRMQGQLARALAPIPVQPR